LGNKANSQRLLRSVNAEIQSFADKFPAQGNREFSNVLQGRFFDKQGNYRGSAAHVDEPEGDVRLAAFIKMKAGLVIRPCPSRADKR
jgi:hypothetical protein